MTIRLDLLKHTGKAALQGLRMGFILALMYGVLFCLYAVIRSSGQIIASMSLAEGMLPTLAATAINLYINSIQFAVILGSVAALICALAFAVVNLIADLIRTTSPKAKLGLGLVISILICVLLHTVLLSADGMLFDMLFGSIYSYLFWLGLPCLIFIAAIAAWSMNTPWLVRTGFVCKFNG